jgi:hypothetical protein
MAVILSIVDVVSIPLIFIFQVPLFLIFFHRQFLQKIPNSSGSITPRQFVLSVIFLLVLRLLANQDQCSYNASMRVISPNVQTSNVVTWFISLCSALWHFGHSHLPMVINSSL